MNCLSEDCNHCRDVLSRAGYRVREAGTVDEVVALAGDETPLAILIKTRRVSEISEGLIALRLHPTTRQVPILLISTVDGGPPELAEPWEGVDWLSEPITPRGLLEAVQYITTPERSHWPRGQGIRAAEQIGKAHIDSGRYAPAT